MRLHQRQTDNRREEGHACMHASNPLHNPFLVRTCEQRPVQGFSMRESCLFFLMIMMLLLQTQKQSGTCMQTNVLHQTPNPFQGNSNRSSIQKQQPKEEGGAHVSSAQPFLLSFRCRHGLIEREREIERRDADNSTEFTLKSIKEAASLAQPSSTLPFLRVSTSASLCIRPPRETQLLSFAHL